MSTNARRIVLDLNDMTELKCGTCGQLDADIYFEQGFDACLEMVINYLNTQESNEIAKMTVWDFIEYFKEHIVYEADLYKKDG